jgi:SAM-dependent methyltransferase
VSKHLSVEDLEMVTKRASALGPDTRLRYDACRRALAFRGFAPGTILEIGCGQGRLGTHLARLGEYVGLEPDRESCEAARSRLGHLGAATVLNVGFEQLPADRTYDLVCAFEVLEHLAEDRSALEGWARLVAPGGLLVVTVPGFGHRFSAHDRLVGHYRRYEPDLLEFLFGVTGLEDIRVTRYGFPTSYLVEAVNRRVARRRLARDNRLRDRSMAERTAASGRILRPSGIALAVASAAASPGRLVQLLAPDCGPNLIASGRRPAG